MKNYFIYLICLSLCISCGKHLWYVTVNSSPTHRDKGISTELRYLGADTLLGNISEYKADSLSKPKGEGIGLHFEARIINQTDSFMVVEVPDTWFPDLEYLFTFDTYDKKENVRTEFFRISRYDSASHNLNFTYRKYIAIVPHSEYLLKGACYDTYSYVRFFEDNSDTIGQLYGPLIRKPLNCSFNIQFNYAMYASLKSSSYEVFKESHKQQKSNSVIIDPFLLYHK